MKEDLEILDVAIIGGGPVGIFGLFQCGMLGLKVGIFDNNGKLGGQCSMLYPEKNIYDIPSVSKITAQELIDNLIKQSSKFENKIFLNINIINIQKIDNVFVLDAENAENKENKKQFFAKSIIITSGAGFFTPNKVPIKEASFYENKSLFYSINNKELFRNKKVSILGGGDSALDWALELADIGCEVKLIHRRDIFGGHSSSFNSIKNNNNIEVLTPFALSEIIGNKTDGVIEKIKILNINNQEEKEIDCNFLLCFFGLSVNNVLLKTINIENKFNAIVVKNTSKMETSIEGIFAAGDCVIYEGKLKLILTGFSEITSAVYSCYKYIFNKQAHFQHSTSKLN